MESSSKNIVLALIAVLVIGGGIFAFASSSDDDDMGADTDSSEQANDEGVVEDITYTATINNVSDSQPLSPGVFVVHDSSASINFTGQVAHESLESLSEVGDNAAFAEFVAGVDGVKQVITIDDPIAPGESTVITFAAPESGYYLSGIQMAVASNDGYALLDSVSLSSTAVNNAVNLDHGSEENTELGSGFAGGQPDPERGEENLENGTPTDPQAETAIHPQLTDTIMTVEISAS